MMLFRILPLKKKPSLSNTFLQLGSHWVWDKVNQVEAIFTYLVGQTVTLSVIVVGYQEELSQCWVT